MARRGLLSAMARPKRAHVDVDRTKIANRRFRRRDSCNPLNAVPLTAASKRNQRGCCDLITIPSVKLRALFKSGSEAKLHEHQRGGRSWRGEPVAPRRREEAC